jgi:hypothetical protein
MKLDIKQQHLRRIYYLIINHMLNSISGQADKCPQGLKSSALVKVILANFSLEECFELWASDLQLVSWYCT